MPDFILSAFPDEYAEDLKEQCEALARFGIPYMEMRGVNGKNVASLGTEEVKQAKSILADYGIKVSAIGSPLGKIKADGDLRAHRETARRVFAAANELGASNVRIFSFYLPEGKTREECRGKIFDELGELVQLSEEFGVTLCHENEALIYGESPEKCLEILDYFGGKMKAVFDMGNFVLDGFNPAEAYRILKKHIEYFHIKDALYAGAVVPAGKGEAKIREILCAYKSDSVKDTFITLEPHLQTFTGLNALAGKTFDNPYKYKNAKEAFTDAVVQLRSVL